MIIFQYLIKGIAVNFSRTVVPGLDRTAVRVFFAREKFEILDEAGLLLGVDDGVPSCVRIDRDFSDLIEIMSAQDFSVLDDRVAGVIRFAIHLVVAVREAAVGIQRHVEIQIGIGLGWVVRIGGVVLDEVPDAPANLTAANVAHGLFDANAGGSCEDVIDASELDS